ncbi:hypothetical protein CTI12_AA179970 [Artemisia annua]|uniref:Uncharacterized protein n=1 Tax=Artemisia annua TaxID=35608 RepID=A0A2U1P991_ARTAN|nr:hypothetical protein CTI12_AA179970 [Artemisia annua]
MEHGPHPPPFTREGILSLNDGSLSLEQARNLFNVDLLTFKAKLMQESILVWNEVNGLKVRVHGCDDKKAIVISFCDRTKYYLVNGTDPFEDVIRNMIERDLKLSRGDYELFYFNEAIERDVDIETDLDWHNAVAYFDAIGTAMFLECNYPLPAA